MSDYFLHVAVKIFLLLQPVLRISDMLGWYGPGSRSADPCHWVTDRDPALFGPGSCSFRQWLSRCQQK